MKKLFTPLAAVMLCTATLSAQSPLTIVETGEGCSSLNDALKDVTDGQTIMINQDINFTSTISPGTKNITIIGADGVVLNHTNSGVLINVKESGSLTVKNLNINYSGDPISVNYIQQSAGTLIMEDVSISNATVTASNGLIRTLTSPVSTVFNNIKFTNCTVPNDYYLFNVANNYGVTLKGEWSYTICLNNATAYIIDGGVTNQYPAAINFQKKHTTDLKVVENCTDMFKFYPLNNNGLTIKDGNLVATDKYTACVAIEGEKVTAAANVPAAAEAIVSEGTVLLYADGAVTKAQTVQGKTITFRGVRPTVSLDRPGDRIIGNAQWANTYLTFQDLNITSTSEANTAYLFQATVANSSVTLRNITITGVHNTGANVLARANAGGMLNFDGVTCTDCSVEGDAPLFTVNQNGCTLSGANSGVSIRLNNGASSTIDASGLVEGATPISLSLYSSANGFALFSGCTDADLFAITNNNWSLAPNAMGGLSLVDASVGLPDVAELFPASMETIGSFYSYAGGTLVYPWCIRLDEGATTLTFNVPDGYNLYYRIDPYDRLSDDPYLEDYYKDHPDERPDAAPARRAATDVTAGMTLYTEPIEVPTQSNLRLTLADRNNLNNNASQILQVTPYNLVQTGVETVAAECAPAQYYTLSGIAVSADALTPGIYVVRRGNTASKVIIK